jgi:hypothetical protein
MSSGGQVVGGIVGATVGFFAAGGPAGAVYGAQIGMSIGGLLDPPKGPTVEGPRLNDLTVQTSTYGQFIPRTYGTIGLSGNVFWLENNKIKEVVKKKKSGGKGGGSSTTVKTYTYFATFAVGLCEGPIAGVRRIWVGPDLVYDAGSNDLETIIASNQASSKFTIYLGTDTQQPDPRMQAEMGVANCPAYRGIAYIVVKDLALADYGNSVAGAQIKVEVVNSQSAPSTRKLVEASPITAAGSPQPGYLQSGSIVDIDGAGAYAMNGVFGGPTSYSINLNGYASIPMAVGATDIYSNTRSLISDSADFAGWLGNVLNAYITTNGIIYSGAINQTTGQIVKKDGQFYYFEEGGSIARKCSTSPDPLTIKNYTIQPSVAHCVYGNYAYGLSPGYSMLYAWNILDFTLSYSIPIDSSIFLGTSGETISYTDGSKIYIAMAASSVERVISVNVSSGEVSIYGDFEIWPGNNSKGAIRVSGNIYQRLYYGDVGTSYKNTITYRTFQLEFSAGQDVTLSSIISSEAKRSSLIKPADINTAGLTDAVTGFKVTATGSIRNAIEPLRGAWPFDVVQSGYNIKATTRGSASVVTIPVGELAIDTQLTESREMDSQLPQNVTVKYIDRDRDYDVNEQRAQRDNTEAVNSLVVDLPVVLSATQSAQVAEKLIRIYALEKSDFSFVLPAPYRYLEPGDVITIATSDADFVLRLMSVNYTADGRLECAARPSSASMYTSIAPGDMGQSGGATIPLAGSTVGIIIDCPVIDEELQNAPGFASAFTGYSGGWPGGILYRTADGGQTWTDLQAFTGKSTAGYAQSPLSVNAGNIIQKGGSLTVSLISGALESVTEAQMLNGANIAAYGVNGRWEIIRFQNATLNGDGTYTLDTFWRGDRGTEWATGLHAANDYFVLMTDPDVAFVGMPTDSIGQPRDYRSVTVGASIDSATSWAFTYTGVNLETYSGAHPVGSRSANDLTISWKRRTRVVGAWRDNVDASLGETTEAYEVDIMQGVAVKRTLTATTPTVLYTSAMQVTDFGSNQASVAVKIYQLSSVVGRGYPLEATL